MTIESHGPALYEPEFASSQCSVVCAYSRLMDQYVAVGKEAEASALETVISRYEDCKGPDTSARGCKLRSVCSELVLQIDKTRAELIQAREENALTGEEE